MKNRLALWEDVEAKLQLLLVIDVFDCEFGRFPGLIED